MDLSDNPLEIDNFEPFFSMKIKCLIFKNSEISKNFKDFRKTFISKIPSLTYFDGREVSFEERRLVEAWNKGGIEAEKEERA